MAHSLRIPLRILQTIKRYKGKVLWKVLIWSWFGCVLCKWQTSGMWPLIKNTLNSHILTYELSNVLFIRWNFLWYSPLHTNTKQCKQLLVNEIHFHFQLHCSSGVMLREVHCVTWGLVIIIILTCPILYSPSNSLKSNHHATCPSAPSRCPYLTPVHPSPAQPYPNICAITRSF